MTTLDLSSNATLGLGADKKNNKEPNKPHVSQLVAVPIDQITDPIEKAKLIEQKLLLEAENAKAKEAVAAKPVESKATVAAKPVESKATVAAKPAEAKGTVAVKPTEAKAAVAAKPTEAKAVVAVKPAEAKGTVAAKPTETKAAVAAKPTEAKAVVAVKPAEAKAVVAVKPAEAKAAVAAKPAETAKPATMAKPAENIPTPVQAKADNGVKKLSMGGGANQKIKNTASCLVRRGKKSFWLILLVLLPMLLASIYLFALAKDRYTSESIVVVKQAGGAASANLNLGALLGGNTTTMREDAMLLQQYILSPDMLKKMDKKLNLKKAFANSGWDILQKLPKDISFEDYLDYYRSKVSVVFDEKTSVLTINTQGFTPKFAQQFNQALLAESEGFINELSHKISREEMQFANQEVNRSYSQLQAAKENVLIFQNENNIVDPQVQIEITTRLVAELQARKSQQEAELTNLLTYLQDDAPQVVAMKNGIDSIKKQIEKEQSALTSVADEQLNQKMAEFEELKAKVQFEMDLYKLSLAALEKSRVEAAKKAKSLSVISKPYLPEDPTYPQKWYRLLTVFLISILVYGMAKVMVSIIEDHRM